MTHTYSTNTRSHDGTNQRRTVGEAAAYRVGEYSDCDGVFETLKSEIRDLTDLVAKLYMILDEKQLLDEDALRELAPSHWELDT